MAFSNPVTGGQGQLIRPAIKSPNYNPGVAGWTINRDGSAEFNNLTIRGTFFGTSYILNISGAFFYNGTPAAGNLILSIAAAVGTDSFGNAYDAGLATYAAGLDTYHLDAVTGNTRFGTSPGAHWLFDVAQSQFTMYDKNALLSMEMSAQVGNSFFFWLSNIAKQFFAVVDGALLFGTLTTAGALPTGPDQVNAAQFSLVTGSRPALQINSLENTSGAGSSGLTAQLYSGNPVVSKPGSTNNAKLALLGSGGGSVDIELFGGALYRGDLSGIQIPSYNANWSTGTTFNGAGGLPGLQYWIDGMDNLVVWGAFKAGAILPGAVVTNIPAPYRPLANAWIEAWRNAGGTVTKFGLQVTTGGNINVVTTMNGGLVASAEYYVSPTLIPLGNLP